MIIPVLGIAIWCAILVVAISLLPPPVISASAPPTLSLVGLSAHHLCAAICQSPSASWLEDPWSPPPASESRTPPRHVDPAAPISHYGSYLPHLHCRPVSRAPSSLGSTLVCRRPSAASGLHSSGSVRLLVNLVHRLTVSASGSSSTCFAWSRQPFFHHFFLAWLLCGPLLFLGSGSHLAPPAPSPFCLFPGSSLHRLHPDFCSSSSSQVSSLRRNLHLYFKPAFLPTLCLSLSPCHTLSFVLLRSTYMLLIYMTPICC